MSFFFVFMTSLPKIHASASSVTRSSLKSMTTHFNLQHNPSPSPAPTISSTTCPNGLEDGNYLFRSYSEQSWSFCGVSGVGYSELSFQISDCECHAGVSGGVCTDLITFSSLAPTSVTPSIMHSVEQSPTPTMISDSPSLVPNLSPPTIPHHLAGLHCSANNYFISPEETCLLITLSDQYGDGWTSGDGSSENAWFGYSFSSSNGDSSDVTYHSLNCSCPRMIGYLNPSSFAFVAEDQTIDLAIYSNQDSPVAFSWEIMYLVQVIQNGLLLDSHYGGYRTHMEFSYSHSSGTLSLSTKTDGAPGNGDAVDMSKCQELRLLSDMSLEGWSIVDVNSNKQDPIASRNPSCVHTHFRTSLVPLDPLPILLGASPSSSVPHFPAAQSKLFEDSPCAHQRQDSFSFPTVPASSRHLTGELGEVGNVTTLAGGTASSGLTNGVGTIALFNSPVGVSISPDGVYALVTDRSNHLIRQIIISTASVTTLAGGATSSGSTNGVGTIALFNNPYGVSISPDGVYALVTDHSNHLIRQIIISTASVTTLTGGATSSGSTNGVGTIARFYRPVGVIISPDGVYALVADNDNHLIRQIIISTASVTTLAGGAGSAGSTNGIGTIALFKNPRGVSISPDGVYALVADTHNYLIRQIIISTASVTTLAGGTGSFGSTNGVGTIALFKYPQGVSISPDGVYALVGDTGNHLIRQIIISTASVTTLAGGAGSAGSTNGIGTIALFKNPFGVSISQDGVYALVGEESNHLIRQIIISKASSSASPTFTPSVSPSTSPTFTPSVSPSTSPTFTPSVSPSTSPTFTPSVSPSTSPTFTPSVFPSSASSISPPSVPPITRFSFGVKIGDKAILVDYLQDARRGQTLPLHHSSTDLTLLQGK
jgi:DNA-binding beta-propeller fold protein YncE